MARAPMPTRTIGIEAGREGPVQTSNRNSVIAAAVIMIGFGVVGFYMPTIMLAVGNLSPIAAGAVAVLFVAAFFLVFWLRARAQKRDGGD